jgi:hypothetical protein
MYESHPCCTIIAAAQENVRALEDGADELWIETRDGGESVKAVGNALPRNIMFYSVLNDT